MNDKILMRQFPVYATWDHCLIYVLSRVSGEDLTTFAGLIRYRTIQFRCKACELNG